MSSGLHAKSAVAAALAFLLLVLSACRPIVAPRPPVEVPFETIVDEEWGTGLYDAYTQDPHLILVTSESEFSLYAPYILPEHLSLVRNIDFSKYAALMLLRDMQGGSKHQVVIESITKGDDMLVVRAQFWEPAPGEAAATVQTLPYHIVRIGKAYTIESTKLELQSYPVHK